MNKILIIAFSLFTSVAFAQNSDSIRIKNQEKIEELKKRVSDLEDDRSRPVSNYLEENNRLKLFLKQYQDSVSKLNALLASGSGFKTTRTNLYFELGANSVNYDLSPQLDLVLDQFKTDNNFKIKLVGHTDKSGKEVSNLALSKERAENLRSYLINKRNIPAERIITEWKGSSNPPIKNAARISPDCRRVEISLIQ